MIKNYRMYSWTIFEVFSIRAVLQQIFGSRAFVPLENCIVFYGYYLDKYNCQRGKRFTVGVPSIRISDAPSLRCVAPQDFFKITVVRGLDHNWDICQYFVSSRPFWNSKNLPRFGILVLRGTNREVTKGALITYRLGGRGGACDGGLWLRREGGWGLEKLVV